MKTFLTLAIASVTSVAVFFGSVLAIEMLTWFWLAPADPLAEPTANALRFAVAIALGLGSGFAVLPSVRRLKIDALAPT